MRIFFIFSFIFILSSCTTIEVAKEVTKASQSIKTSVSNMINSNQETNSMDDNKDLLTSKSNNIKEEAEEEEEQKKNERAKIKDQKKIVSVVFLGKTHEEIKELLGVPQLKRTDGNIEMLRFDVNNCRLFLFFKIKNNPVNVKYFELRDNYGILINVKKKIQGCYKDLNLI